MLDIFRKIREKKNSGLESQQLCCAFLTAVEDVIKGKGCDLIPTAYFANFMVLIGQHIENEKSREEELCAILCLLATVMPYVPHAVLQKQFSDTSLTLMEVLQRYDESSAIQRYVLDSLCVLVSAQEAAAWSSSSMNQLFQVILIKCLDETPKIRKQAQLGVLRVLSKPPPPLKQHPASLSYTRFILSALKSDQQSDENVFYTLQLLKESCKYINTPYFQQIGACLMKSSTERKNPQLLASVYQTISAIFEQITLLEDSQATFVTNLVNLCIERRPDVNDHLLLPLWLAMIVSGASAMVAVDSISAYEKLGTVFERVFSLLQVTPHTQQQTKQMHEAVRISARALISLISDENIEKSMSTPHTSLHQIIASLDSGLGLSYQNGWAVIFELIGDLFSRLGDNAQLAVCLLQKLANDELYAENRHFPHLEVFHQTIGQAISAFGARDFLVVFEMDIVESKLTRPWLLPLLKDNIRNPELKLFLEYIAPLSQRVAELGKHLLTAEKIKNKVEGKMCAIVWKQMWELLPSFCDRPVDIQQHFGQLLSMIMPLLSSYELVPVVCDSLKQIVSSLDTCSDASCSQEHSHAQDDVRFLSKFAEQIFPDLFTKYIDLSLEENGKELPLIQLKTSVLNAIKAWMVVAEDEALNRFFESTLRNFLQMMKETPDETDMKGFIGRKHALLDLANAILSSGRLSVDALSILARIAVLGVENDDGTMQKKCYKILYHIVKLSKEIDTLAPHFSENDDFVGQLLENLEKSTLSASSASKRDRFALLKEAVGLLDWRQQAHSRFIPAILSETVLGNKEPNEKARNEAYGLLIAIAQHIIRAEEESQGNFELKVCVPAEDGEEEGVVAFKANLDEFVKMVLAGLAAKTPQMISASIHALSRLLYEFRPGQANAISDEVLDILVQTVMIYARDCKNREIIKACVGFLKVIVATCSNMMNTDMDSMDEDCESSFHLLGAVIEACLRWTKEHKSHFKMSCRYIIERLVRKFGLETVAKFIPEEHAKLVTNIRKRKERSKKKVKFADATDAQLKSFDQLVHEEEEGSDDGGELPELFKELVQAPSLRDSVNVRLLDEGDEPIDFMDSSAIKSIVHGKPVQKKRKDSQMKTNEEGRLVVEDSEAEIEEETEMDAATYLESLTNPDAYKRSADGKRVKFSNKRKAQEDDGEDEYEAPLKQPKKRRSAQQELKRAGVKHTGNEYKSKKGRGDVKKQGKPDPFAYIPLNPKVIGTNRGKKKINKDLLKV